jgi:hypothetical protein
MFEAIVPGVPLVNSAKCTLPILGKGVFHPPKNKIEAKNPVNNIIAYSDKKNIPNLNPEYSTWYPATSSDSASGMSNGALLHSANDEMK